MTIRRGGWVAESTASVAPASASASCSHDVRGERLDQTCGLIDSLSDWVIVEGAPIAGVKGVLIEFIFCENNSQYTSKNKVAAAQVKIYVRIYLSSIIETIDYQYISASHNNNNKTTATNGGRSSRAENSLFTFSMISISPPFGQSGPTSQSAGQTEHPCGMA